MQQFKVRTTASGNNLKQWIVFSSSMLDCTDASVLSFSLLRQLGKELDDMERLTWQSLI